MTESCKSSNRSSSTSSPTESPVLSAITTTEEECDDGEDGSSILDSKYLKQKQEKKLKSEEDRKPSFNYNLEIFNLCKEYLNTKNHHGLALIARQKGIPPFLRFKVWPILLKYHPFVLNPFIQPDTDIIKEANRNLNNSDNDTKENTKAEKPTESGSHSASAPASSDTNDAIKHQVRRDLAKYIQRLKYSNTKYTVSELEHEILSTLEHSIIKFSRKWGKIIKYDEALTWIALNLAEWFPPIPKTPWVLMGRDHSSPNHLLTVNLLDDYSNYIDNIPELREYLEELIYKDERISHMSFHEVYERLVLVLLHCPEPASKKKRGQELAMLKKSQSNKERKHDHSDEDNSDQPKLNKTTLPITGGTIEERVSYFIYCLRKLLPELSQFFQEEQVLTKFGTSDDEWIIWWLKFCGSKVWSRYDRGRIWDLLLGWRLQNPKKDFNYYYEKLNYPNRNTLEKLGPDIFWSLTNEEETDFKEQEDEEKTVLRQNSFRNLIEELTLSQTVVTKAAGSPDSTHKTTSSSASSVAPSLSIPFSKLDPHISLIFISLALLKSRENSLVELDQHEIRQFLSRLPSKAYKYKSKKKNGQQQGNSTSSSSSNSPVAYPIHDDSNDISSSIMISNDSAENHKVNYIDNIIQEAGELWRKWLWVEMIDDN